LPYAPSKGFSLAAPGPPSPLSSPSIALRSGSGPWGARPPPVPHRPQRGRRNRMPIRAEPVREWLLFAAEAQGGSVLSRMTPAFVTTSTPRPSRISIIGKPGTAGRTANTRISFPSASHCFTRAMTPCKSIGTPLSDMLPHDPRDWRYLYHAFAAAERVLTETRPQHEGTSIIAVTWARAFHAGASRLPERTGERR